MKTFNVRAFFRRARPAPVSEATHIHEPNTTPVAKPYTETAASPNKIETSGGAQPTQSLAPEYFEASQYGSSAENMPDEQTTSEALSEALFPHSLREDYFLAMQCERPTCGYNVRENLYKFCPKCGYTTKPIYDYYRMFALTVTAEGVFDETRLKKNFRELSLHYHPDLQAPAPQGTSLNPSHAYAQTPKSPHTAMAYETQRHDNFSFLAAALEILKTPILRMVYHKNYQDALQALFPEQFARLYPPQPVPETSPIKLNHPQQRPFSFQNLRKRLLLLGVAGLDIFVIALIVFLVMKTYLWGASFSLLGAWLYFRKTRQFLNHLYS